MKLLQLDASKLFNQNTFYSKLAKDIKISRHSIIIESPFMTTKRTMALIPSLRKATKKGVEVKIFTREPAHHSKTMELEAIEAIQLLKRIGVRVFACSDMRHRKIAIIDRSILWEGSLNIFSQSNSQELMRRTVSSAKVNKVMDFMDLS